MQTFSLKKKISVIEGTPNDEILTGAMNPPCNSHCHTGKAGMIGFEKEKKKKRTPRDRSELPMSQSFPC